MVYQYIDCYKIRWNWRKHFMIISRIGTRSTVGSTIGMVSYLLCTLFIETLIKDRWPNVRSASFAQIILHWIQLKRIESRWQRQRCSLDLSLNYFIRYVLALRHTRLNTHLIPFEAFLRFWIHDSRGKTKRIALGPELR